MPLSATHLSMTPDRRRLRAQVVTHNALHALEPFIERLERLEEWAENERKKDGEEPGGRPRIRRDMYERLFDLFYAIGVEVITDADRAMAGLEPRNERGTTDTELRIMDARLTEAMLAPTRPFIVKNSEIG